MGTLPVIDAGPLTGTVLNIQHFCTNDGPGIRTTVFLKGCSLRCKWCCNPESIHPKPELAYDLKKCIGEKECGLCLKECPESALYVLASDGKVRVNWDLCTNCGKCTPVCPPQALYLFGRAMTVDEVLAEIETAGNVPWEFMAKVLPHVDTMLHDHKLTDPERHRKWCGADNSRILSNFKKAYETFPDKTFIARTPVIPGVNDDEEHIRSVLAFIRPYPNVIKYELLPYHRYGETKYGFLGRVYELEDFPSLSRETLHRLQAIIDEAFEREGQGAGAT